MASEEAILDRDLFLNLGQVQNLSLDLSEHLAIPEPPVVVLNDDGDADQEIIGGGSGAQEPPKQVVRPTMKSVTEESPHELGNPVTSYSPNHPRAVFLHDLKIGHAAWHCTCDGIGYDKFFLSSITSHNIAALKFRKQKVQLYVVLTYYFSLYIYYLSFLKVG